MPNFKLWEAPLSFKVLVSVFLLMVAIGYIFGLIHIYKDVGFSYTGIVTHHRGEEKELSVPPDFAFAKLIHNQHIHIFGLSLLFFLIGAVFCLTSLPERFKAFMVIMPFLGMFLDLTSFWLLVFYHASFAWTALFFGALMAVAFFLILGRPLYEMWILPIFRRKWNDDVPWFLR